MLAITASSTCAVQILLVAFSRLICCSRVCSDNLSAGLPDESRETPTKRPGILRLYSSFVAKNAACGPPKPIGTPKRCVEPTTISAPILPGGVSKQSANRSDATHTIAPAACALAHNPERSTTFPSVSGYCTRHPKLCGPNSHCDIASTLMVIPSAAARVAITPNVCG